MVMTERRTLALAENLSLPLSAVTKKFGFFGQNGSGKTYGAMKLAELMLGAGGQIVAIDPVGKWYGLRLAANGKDPSGIEIPVFGGLHGDIPLESTAGELVADVIVDRGISAVLDVSQFEYDAERARFVEHFCRRIFHRKKAAPSAIHIYFEEAQEFMPMAPQRGEEKLVHEALRLGKIGRNYGFGWSLITPRPQEITTKARNLSEVVLAFQTNGTHERKAIAEWVKEKGEDQNVVDLLPKLKPGFAHAWSPSWLEFSGTVHINKKETFDASATPLVGAKAVEAKPLGTIDLAQLQKAMAATIEKRKAEDPAELKKQLAAANGRIRQLEKAPASTPAKVVTKPVVDQAAIAKAVARDRAERRKKQWPVLDRLQRGAGGLGALITAIGDLAKIVNDIEAPQGASVVGRTIDAVEEQRIRDGEVRRTARPARIPAHRSDAESPSSIGKGERRMLAAIAQYPEGAERDQLTVLTGYKRSSRDTYIQRLAAAGLVEITSSGIRATDAGVETLGSDYEPLPQGEELQDYWLNRLPEGERKILSMLIDRAGEPIDREEISDKTGYKRSSRDTYLQRLSSRRLVENVGRGEVRASANLFEGALV